MVTVAKFIISVVDFKRLIETSSLEKTTSRNNQVLEFFSLDGRWIFDISLEVEVIR